jgi:translation initiation factor 5A
VNLDEDEVRGFLEPFLAIAAVDNMIQLLLGSALDCTSTTKLVQRFDEAASMLQMQEASLCDVAVAIAEESANSSTQKRLAKTARRTLREKASQLDKKQKSDEAEFCDSDCLDGDVVEAGVLKARCVKTGHHVIINNRPCRVEKIGTSKVWKGPQTGCFKSHLVARCIFTGKKFEHLCPATEDVRLAVVQKLECTVMDIGNDGELCLLTSAFDTKTDINLPTESDDDRNLAERIKVDFRNGRTVVILVASSCGVEKVVEIVRHKCTN